VVDLRAGIRGVHGAARVAASDSSFDAKLRAHDDRLGDTERRRAVSGGVVAAAPRTALVTTVLRAALQFGFRELDRARLGIHS
jgi:hypothetical protein